MSILLILAAFTQAPMETQKCERLDAKKVSTLVTRASDAGYLTGFRALADLVNYWRATCPGDRFKASKRIVKELSGLLQNQDTRHLVPLMLLDVGPNLAAAKPDVDSAIIDQAAREHGLIKASSPIMPESGIGLANMLRCVRHKIDTGKLDPKLCWATWTAY
jgi:hypothetical protein